MRHWKQIPGPLQQLVVRCRHMTKGRVKWCLLCDRLVTVCSVTGVSLTRDAGWETWFSEQRHSHRCESFLLMKCASLGGKEQECVNGLVLREQHRSTRPFSIRKTCDFPHSERWKHRSWAISVCFCRILFKDVSPKPQLVFIGWQWLIFTWEGISSLPLDSSLFHCFCLCNLFLIYYITSYLAPTYNKSLNS